jgi:hypothetical protein
MHSPFFGTFLPEPNQFTVPEEVLRGDLRPLRMPEEADEELEIA